MLTPGENLTRAILAAIEMRWERPTCYVMAMTRQELINRSEAHIRLRLGSIFRRRPESFRSRSRRDHRWNSDYDLWIDATFRQAIGERTDQFDESCALQSGYCHDAATQRAVCRTCEAEAIPWM
jgi:hypothetical protein